MPVTPSNIKWLRTSAGNGFPILTRIFYSLVALVILTGAMVLIGWEFDLVFLKRPLPGLAAMNPLTAVCFILGGVAFVLTATNGSRTADNWAKVLSLLIIIICLTSLVQVMVGAAAPIDQHLFESKLKASRLNDLSRMAINTAVSFVIFSVALLLLQSRKPSAILAAHFLSFIIFLFGFFQLLGYAYGAPEFFEMLSRLPMAIHTAICFILLAIAIFLVYPQQGLTRAFTREWSGRRLSFYLMASAIVVPTILGGFRIYTHRIQLFSTPLGITLLVLSIIVIFSALCLYFVTALYRQDRLKQQSEESLHESREIYRSLVLSIKDYAIFRIDKEGYILTWNKGAEAIKGYTEEEIKGKHISVFYTAADQENNLPARLLHLTEEIGQYEVEGWRVRKDGSVFWADVILTALYDQHGVLNGFAKVTRDITENKKNKDLLADFNRQLTNMVNEKTLELERTTEQLRQLASYLQTAREEERKNLAREMHDELGQMLTGLRMDMVWLKKHASGNELLQARFDRALELLAETRQIMRRLATELHPAMLEDLGLTVALASYSREFESRFPIKITFSFELNGLNEMQMAKDMTIAVYRIFQESLNNVAKHSKATKVTALLRVSDQRMMLEIRDNGEGFDVNMVQQKKTLGLVSIRERTIMLNGKSEITSSPGKGTTIKIEAPLKLEHA